jgi:carboxyl-terminal processing protease
VREPVPVVMRPLVVHTAALAVLLVLPVGANAQPAKVEAAWHGLAFDAAAFAEVVALARERHVRPAVPDRAWLRAAEGAIAATGRAGSLLPRDVIGSDGLMGSSVAIPCAATDTAPFVLWQPENGGPRDAATVDDLRKRRQLRRELGQRVRKAWDGRAFSESGMRCAMAWARTGGGWSEPLPHDTTPTDVDQRGFRAWRMAADFFLHALDSHSTVLPGRLFDAADADLGTQDAVGVGLELQRDGGGWVVRRCDEGGPAARAQLRPGDRLLAVDGALPDAWSSSRLGTALGGTAGSAVVLRLRRGAAKAFTVKLVRASLRHSAVAGWLVGEGIPVGVVKIPAFATGTERDLRRELEELRNDGKGRLGALVVDLRGNEGGWVEEALGVADAFLPRGVIVTLRTRDGEVERHDAAVQRDDEPRPLVVLVDPVCKSACELVTAALRGNGRAIVVGGRTFGKGSVQKVLEAKRGDWYVILTVAQYHGPRGEPLQAAGIEPDVVVPGMAGDDLRETDFADHLAPAGDPARGRVAQSNACIAPLQDCARRRQETGATRLAKEDPALALAADIAACLVAHPAWQYCGPKPKP